MNALWNLPLRPLLEMREAGIALPHAALHQINLQLLAGDCLLILGKDFAANMALLRLAAGKMHPHTGECRKHAMHNGAMLLSMHTLPKPCEHLQRQLKQSEHNWLIGLLGLENWVYGHEPSTDTTCWRIALAMSVLQQCSILAISLPPSEKLAAELMPLAHEIGSRYGMAVLMTGRVHHLSSPYFTHLGILEGGSWAWKGELPQQDSPATHEALLEIKPSWMRMASWVIQKFPTEMWQIAPNTLQVRMATPDMLGKINRELVLYGIEVQTCAWAKERLESALGALMLHETQHRTAICSANL